MMVMMTSASLMHEAGHQRRCMGTTQRDKMGKEVGGGFTMGGTHVYL